VLAEAVRCYLATLGTLVTPRAVRPKQREKPPKTILVLIRPFYRKWPHLLAPTELTEIGLCPPLSRDRLYPCKVPAAGLATATPRPVPPVPGCEPAARLFLPLA